MNLSFISLSIYLALSQCYFSDPLEYKNEDFEIKSVKVSHDAQLGLSIWEISVNGKAGKTTPRPAGQLNGAPVLGYVFPTNLSSTDVGFGKTEGIVALALTSHPDFDDTPLWDENQDQKYDNDGIVWHPHWVVLQKDERIKGGLSVKQFDQDDPTVVLPPTNPGMPMYMDSPGYPVKTNGNTIQVIVPDYRWNVNKDLKFDGVAAYMQVNTEDPNKPLLGVYEVYSIASG
ncbi:MAG: hypothetical protein AAFU64_15280, partial [Bacteroidota bacterium]